VYIQAGSIVMADLIDEIRSLAAKIERSKDAVSTEEATKNAYIMPFISLLGYDVFDPTEVTPELTADVGVKKGEKIDYAILKDGKPIMLFECKHHGASLDSQHASQLFRYFSCSECRVAILTNGVEYRFFTDLEAPNKMDSKPFMVFKVTDFPESLIPELKKVTKDSFEIDAILSTASELKYTREIKGLLSQQLLNPNEEFVKFCANGIGIARMTPATKDQFKELTKRAMSDFISDRISEKLKAALGTNSVVSDLDERIQGSGSVSNPPTEGDSSLETTVDELEGYYIVRAILREIVDIKRVVHRDQQSYFGILLDDNNRKPIMRLRFNSAKQKYISLFDENRVEERIAISSLDDIYQYADRIRTTVKLYIEPK
jgi:predicted type IV restriction endonuclease